jgi:small subunit ribosomal protein S1
VVVKKTAKALKPSKKETKTRTKKPKKKKLEIRDSKKIPTSHIRPPTSKPEPQTMEELLAQTGYKIRGLKRGEMVSGTITFVSSSEILVDIGAKSEGVIANRDFEQNRDFIKKLKVDDEISAQVLVTEDEAGQAVLSVRAAAQEAKWKELNAVKDAGTPIKVLGLEANRGGLIVDCLGLRGFIPSSQLAVEHVGQERNLINQKVSAKIIEFDQAKNRLVLSEKQVLSPKEQERRQKTWDKTKVGDKITGKVVGVFPFGVFVDFQGVEGLIHISEIAWERVQTPASYFKVGDKVTALVIGKEEEAGRFQLSAKQLVADPWTDVSQKYSPNQEVEGKVVKTEVFGVFVRLEEGIDGLLHISKTPPGTTFKVGDKIKCIIEIVESDKRRISLTLLPKEKPVGYK